ncbi:MAG: DUF1616 domain-containing protein [Halobacteriota archaeon]
MNTRSGYWHADLAAVVGWVALAAGAAFLDVGGLPRLVLMAPVVAFLPGWAAVSLVFPTVGTAPAESAFDREAPGMVRTYSRGGHAVGGVERVALSVLLSVVIVPTVALGVHFSPWAIRVEPLLAGIAGITVLLALLALGRRATNAPEERYTVPLPVPSPRPYGALGSTRAPSVWGVLLALSLLVLASSVGYALVAPPQPEGFTELYVRSGPVTNETTSLYPSTLTQGESQEFHFAVENHEHETVAYTYVVLFQRVETADAGTRVVASEELDRGGFELGDGEATNASVQVTPRLAGDELRVVVLLYEDDVPANPSVDTAYRVLDLPVDVLAGGAASEASR